MATGKTNLGSWLIPAVFLILLALALAKPNDPKSNESCGINMECVPRSLCQDGIIKDDGFSLISPTIGQAKCPKTLHRCCQVKQKEDDSQL